MLLDRIALTDFRNHATTVLDGAAMFNVLLGENGAGKTNILEAISLLSPGRGLRRSPLEEMVREDGAGGFAVSAGLGEITLGTGVVAGAPGRRQVRINGTGEPAAALSERLSLSWLTPAMDGLFRDSEGGRRRFIDRLALALFPAHANHASRYEGALRERNRLLSDNGPPDMAWLEAIEARMAHHGGALGEARAELASALNTVLADMEGGPFAIPRLDLHPSLDPDEDTMRAAFREARPRDRAAGRTLSGPHRDELAVTMRAKGIGAARASTGEQKAMLIALVLAHARMIAARSARPMVLLLDELVAHLDESRRQALFEALAGNRAQVWMTGTDAELFNGLERRGSTRLWTVSGGQVSDRR